ncbi:cation:proton antiporter [Methanoculleus sp. UBA303]|jgi:CPA2 family monovalent cation:H+ antiporter-2|uniref:cation:proton antiporter n=1 Tax=Methanoculleus sp. UBA303 TaxID=1915497 RepID=UPI0025D618F6|nr:cation:proton antiporter [Methanoculleus sp. UBA303]MDD3934259.1 cation:proton antiporter [Methanoculleus sp.]
MEEIAIALGISLILALVSRRLSLPPVPFYILAGLALGKSGLSLVTPSPVSDFFVDLGLVFLLFYVGLELKPDRILAKRSAFLKVGLIDLNINLAIGFVAALALGFPFLDAIVVASAFYISSSVIAFASILENKKMVLRESETVVWMMVFEDIVLVFLIVALHSGFTIPVGIVARFAVVAAIFFLVCRWGKEPIRRILNRDDELPVLLTFTLVVAAAFFAQAIGIPDTLTVIALGAALSTTSPSALERQARPFKDVFLVLFFVFFGISVEFSGEIGLAAIAAVSLLAVLSKLISGVLIGRQIHGSATAGIEIWSNTIARGEFSIIIAALYGSAAATSIIAGIVVATSVAGSFAAKYSPILKQHWARLRSRFGLKATRPLMH